jgi:hypothetical protein
MDPVSPMPALISNDLQFERRTESGGGAVLELHRNANSDFIALMPRILFHYLWRKSNTAPQQLKRPWVSAYTRTCVVAPEAQMEVEQWKKLVLDCFNEPSIAIS